MVRRLPPLNGLRAFEAAARHLSFKKAADELSVTPAAISQQVRALEAHVGRPLFHRLTRALELTDAGQAGLPALGEGFDKLAEAAEIMRRPARTNILTVSVAPSFGAKWLVPRLERFHQAHPEVDVRIDATDALASFAADGVDVALRYGRGAYRNLVAELLMPEVAFPVCSPALLERGPPLRTPADLKAHTLLHVQWKMEQESAPTWRMWLRAAGVEDIDTERGLRFGADSMAVEAAAEGHGVALASGALVLTDLKSGRLVRPFPPSVAEATAFAYYLVCPEEKLTEPKVTAFRDWVRAEAAQSTEPSAG
ncbi:MAG: transcriptional regulator GcvA [Rhodospirillaceae bacterium]|nr:transcriptional regulator GcvA [Rhodospirillaceae bacterium]